MNKGIIAAVVAVLIIGGIAGAMMLSGDDDNKSTNSSSNTSTNQDDSTSDTTTDDNNISNTNTTAITLADVAKHNTQSDCWTVISGSVYDLTSYIPRHPEGPETITMACGKDGTTLFTQRTTEDGQKVGNGQPHSAMAEQQLSSLKVGELSQ